MKAGIGPGTRYGWRGALAFPGDFFDAPAGAIVGSASLSISATGTLVDAAASSTPVFTGGTPSGVITNSGRTWAYAAGGSGTAANVLTDTAVTGKKYVEFACYFTSDTYLVGSYYARSPISLSEADAIPYMSYGTAEGGGIVSKWSASFMANYGMAQEASGNLTPTPDGTIPVTRTVRMMIDADARTVQFALDGGSFTAAITIPGSAAIYVGGSAVAGSTVNSITLRLAADNAYSTPAGYDNYMADASPPGALVGATSLSIAPGGGLTGQGRRPGSTTLGITPTGQLRGTGRRPGSTTLAITCTATGRRFRAAAGTTTLSLAPAGVVRGEGRLIGAASLSIAATGAMAAPSGLVGSTTLSITPAGALAGVGALAGASLLGLQGSATGTLQAAIAGSTPLSIAPSAALTASGALAGAATLAIASAGSLQGRVDVAGQASIALVPSATLAAHAALAGATTLALDVAAPATAAGALVGMVALSIAASGGLAGNGTIQIVGSTALSITAAGSMAVEASIEGATTLSLTPAGSLEGRTALTGAAPLAIAAVATGNLTGKLDGAALVAVAMVAELLGRAALQGSASLSLNARANAYVDDASLIPFIGNRPPSLAKDVAERESAEVMRGSRPAVEELIGAR